MFPLEQRTKVYLGIGCVRKLEFNVCKKQRHVVVHAIVNFDGR